MIAKPEFNFAQIHKFSIPLKQCCLCNKSFHRYSDEAATVMLELLRSYDDSNLAESNEDAKTCVVDALKNPESYLFDHLLALKPITNLRGDWLYDVSTAIFCYN